MDLLYHTNMAHTTSQYQPHRHIMIGRRGDGVPASAPKFGFRFAADPIAKGDYEVLCQLRDADGALAHEYTPILEDYTDDPDIPTNQLNITLPRITSAQSTLLTEAEYVGDLQISEPGGTDPEPTTVLLLNLSILSQVTQ